MRRRYALVAAALVVLVAVATGAALAADSGGPPATDGTIDDIAASATPATDADSPPLTSTAESTDVRIDPAVEDDDSDETTVIVTLADPPGPQPAATTREEHITSLQSQAADSQTPLERFAEGHPGVEIERQLWITNAVVLTIDQEQTPLEQLGTVENVEAIHENAVLEPEAASAEPPGDEAASPEFRDEKWGLEDVGATAVWEDFDTRGEGTSVAVLDTGVDGDHPALEVDEWQEWDWDGSPVTSDPWDSDGHGTMSSGVVAAGTDDEGNNVGVAPGVEHYHGKVSPGDESVGSSAAILAGIEWAVDNDVDVVTISFGSEGYDTYYADAMQNANDAGTMVFASSGNEGEGTSTSPGNEYDAVSVGAVDSSGSVTDFSSGEHIVTDEAWINPPAHWPDEMVVPDVVAPGEWTWTTTNDGEFGYYHGTSAASPHAAGAAALYLSATDDSVSPAELRSTLRETATDLEEDETRQGAGRVDVHEALLEDSRATLDPQLEDDTVDVGTEATLTLLVDHPIETYTWEFPDGTATETDEATVTHTFDEVGDTEIDVTIEDTGGYTTTESLSVTVEPPSPEVVLAAEPTTDVEVGLESVDLDASESTDAVGIDHYEWAVDGEYVETTTDPTTEVTIGALGNRSLSVTAVNEYGEQNTTSTDVGVVNTVSPEAHLELNRTEPTVGQPVALNASNSSDNHEIVEYRFEAGDETTNTSAPVVDHILDSHGELDVSVTVIDTGDNEATATETVTAVGPDVTVTDPDDAGEYTDENVTVTYELTETHVEDVAGLEYRIRDGETDTTVTDWTGAPFTASEETTTETVDVGPLEDGTYEVEFRLVGPDGDTLDHGGATDAVGVTIQATPPALDLETERADPSFVNVSTNNSLTATVTADGSGHEETTLEIGSSSGPVAEWNLTDETGTGDTAAVTWNATDEDGTPVESGNYTVTATTVDELGNENERTAHVSVDTAAPDVSVALDGGIEYGGDRSLNESSTLTIDVAADDGHGGATRDPDVVAVWERANYVVTPAVDGDAGAWSGTIDGADLGERGEYTIRASVVDEANNENVATKSIRVDDRPPELAVSVTDVDRTTGDGTVRVHSSERLTDTPTVTATGPDGESVSVEGIDAVSDTRWEGTVSLEDDGQYEFDVSGTDRAGNHGEETGTTTVTGIQSDGQQAMVYDESAETFVAFNLTDDADGAITTSVGDVAPYDLGSDRTGATFVSTVLDQTVDDALVNATIGVPVTDDDVDPDDAEYVYYDETTGEWVPRETTVTDVDLDHGNETIDGEYWTTTVEEFSTYGIASVDDSPPTLVDFEPDDPVDTGTETISIEATYEDDQSGVNASAVELVVDGEDLTNDQNTSITSQTATHDGYPVEEGESFTVDLTLEDEAGNSIHEERTVSVDRHSSGGSGGSGGGSGGGGGGGGPAGSAPTQITEVPADVSVVADSRTDVRETESGTATAAFSSIGDDAAINRLHLETDGPLHSEIVVRDYDDVPAHVGPAPGTVLHVTELLYPFGYDDAQGTIELSLETQSIGHDHIAVVQHTDDGWEQRSTDVRTIDDGTARIDADTIGSGYVVITAIDEPTAVMTVSPEQVSPGDEVTLDAGESELEHGSIDEYRWTVGDREYTGEQATVTLDESGAHTVTLTVGTDTGMDATTESTVTVTDEDSDDGIPGFGVSVVFVALVAGIVILIAQLPKRWPCR